MPSPKEAQRQRKRRKQVRRQAFLRARSARSRSAVRTYVKRARAAIDSGDAENAESDIRTAQSKLGAAARKGVIQPRNAARRLSRLVARARNAAAVSE